MKKSISISIILRFLMYVIGNSTMALWWYIEDNFLFFMFHVISNVFMILSLCFFNTRLTYIMNILILIPVSFSVFVLMISTIIMRLTPIAFVIMIFGIINLKVIFSKEIREYFGFKKQEQQHEK